MDRLNPGTVFGQYRIVRFLGRGGMGEVFEAEHEVLKRTYALKLIPGDLASRPGFVDRFKREAQVMANLEHPHIVRVDEFGETEGRFWMRMERISGVNDEEKPRTTLTELSSAQDGRLDQAVLARILVQVLDGLAYAHERGAVHRDLKPANILLEGASLDTVRAKIVDFGLVRLAGEEWVLSRAQESVSLSMSLGDKETARESGARTSTRALLGTYAYMSPEQKEGKRADERSDLYAVGLMAFRLLTGQNDPGFRLPSALDSTLAKAWDAVVLEALEPLPEARFASAGAMLEAIKEVLRELGEGEREEKHTEPEQERRMREVSPERQVENPLETAALQREPDRRVENEPVPLEEPFSEKNRQPSSAEVASRDPAPQPAEASSRTVDLFRPLTAKSGLILVLAVLLGAGCLVEWRLGQVRIYLKFVQVFLVFQVGLQYGRRWGLATGLLVFLPAVVLHYAGPGLGAFTPLGLFRGRLYLSDQQLLHTLSILAYPVLGTVGYAAARLKEWTAGLELGGPCSGAVVSTKGRAFLFVLPALLLCWTCDLGPFRLRMHALVLALVSLIAFRHGGRQGWLALSCALPLVVVHLFPLDNLRVGLSVGVGTLFVYLSTLTVLGPLPHPKETLKADQGRIGFILSVLAAVLLGFRGHINPELSFYGYALAIPILFLTGWRYGSERGVRAGLIVLASSLLVFKISEGLTFGAAWLALSAPAFGYLGGLAARIDRPVNTTYVRVIAGYAALMMAAWIMGGADRLLLYVGMGVELAVSWVLFYVLKGLYAKR